VNKDSLLIWHKVEGLQWIAVEAAAAGVTPGGSTHATACAAVDAYVVGSWLTITDV
jgi:hypothetical protein